MHSKLKKLVQESALRKSPVAGRHALARYLHYSSHRDLKACELVARSLFFVLCSDSAQLWDIMFVMYVTSCMGQLVMIICGPAESGKSSA